MTIFFDIREDVGCRYDPIMTTGFAKLGQCFTLELNAQILIGIIGIQDLEGRTIGSEPMGRIVEGELIYGRDGIDEFLSTLLC